MSHTHISFSHYPMSLIRYVFFCLDLEKNLGYLLAKGLIPNNLVKH